MTGAVDEPTGLDARRAWLSVGMMSLGAFVVVVNATILSPLLRPIALEFGISEAEAGRLGTAAAIVNGLTAILFAPVMDRVSLRAWVVWQSLFLAGITLGSALAPSFAWLFALRALSGASMMMAKCLAACAEVFADERRRNRAIGIVASATTAGVVAGLPVIALVEDAVGWRWAFASLLAPLLLLLLGYRLLPRQAPAHAVVPARGFTGSFRETLGHRPTRRLLFAQCVLGLAYFGWITYLGAYVEIEFGAGAGTLSLIFLLAGAGELLANNLAPLALRRVRAPVAYAGCGIGFAAGLAAGGIGTDALWTVFLTTTAISMFSAGQYILVSIQLLDALPAARGAVMSLASAAMGLGGAAGVALAGFVLDWTDSYAVAFRVLALVIPLGIVAVLTAGLPAPREASAGAAA